MPKDQGIFLLSPVLVRGNLHSLQEIVAAFTVEDLRIAYGEALARRNVIAVMHRVTRLFEK